MNALVPIAAIATGLYLYDRDRRKKRHTASSDVVAPEPAPEPEQPEDPFDLPAPVWDPQVIEGLEDERIEGIYGTAKIYQQENGLYRLAVEFRPPPANAGNWAGTLGVNEPNLSLEKAKSLGAAYLCYYGCPPGPYGTPNDLLVLLHGPGDARFSVWKHATKGTYWAVTRSPGREAFYAEFNDPQAALSYAVEAEGCHDYGGTMVAGKCIPYG